ncbi:MAG: efflux RND transporter periplasmic adaptor subunit [Myxococcota bacterium]
MASPAWARRAQGRTAARTLVLALLLGLPLLVGCSSQEAPAPPVPSVRVVRVTPRPAVALEEYVARISASNTVEIRPQVDGRLEKQAAVEGQRVEAGALLYQIDPAPFRAALARAEAERAQADARLAQARRELERVKQLARSNVASEQMLDAAQTQEKAADAGLRAAKADVETARLQLDYTRVTSPIGGVVGRAEVRIGAAVEAYQTLLTRVYANDPMYVDFSIGEQRMLEMQRRYGSDWERGAGAFRIRLADDSEYPWPGTLDFVDTALDEKSATLPMRLVVPNPDGLLRANQFARVVVPVDAVADALVVPVRAVQDFQGTHSVWVVDDEGQAQSRSVELGARLDDGWIVRQGLEPGARVVVEGVQKLRPGLVVQAQTNAPGDVAAQAPAEARDGVAAKASAPEPAEARNGS